MSSSGCRCLPALLGDEDGHSGIIGGADGCRAEVDRERGERRLQLRHARTNGSNSCESAKDAANRILGRKRGPAVDVLGLIISVVVTAASTIDSHGSVCTALW
jgi:hypothetical protein